MPMDRKSRQCYLLNIIEVVSLWRGGRAVEGARLEIV